jgi:hypothetical protein
MGANGDIRVFASANALNNQEASEIFKIDDKTYSEIDLGIG